MDSDVNDFLDKNLTQVPESILKERLHYDVNAKPCYYGDQKLLSGRILERIRYILEKNHGKQLEDFKEFDYQIYTAKSTTLETQTRTRLENKQSFCVPPTLPPEDIRDYTKQRVKQYVKAEHVMKRHHELLKEAKERTDKLYLIVADEAHWGITGPGFVQTDVRKEVSSTKNAQDELINSWTSDEYPNVLLLLVSATPYNLMTEDTRLPLDVSFAKDLTMGHLVSVLEKGSDGSHRLFNENGEDVTNSVGPVRRVHHVRWTEIGNKKLETGLKLLIKPLVVASWNYKGDIPIYLTPECQDQTGPYLGVTASGEDGKVLVQGHNGRVRIYDSKGRQLAMSFVEGQSEFDLCFMMLDEERKDPTKICDFEMLMVFGEDVFALCPIVPEYPGKLSVYYDTTANRLRVHEKPPSLTLGRKYSVLVSLPPQDLFFIDDLHDCLLDDRTGNRLRYLSLNFYYNTIWNKHSLDRLIRQDYSFEELCQAMKEQQAAGKVSIQSHDDILIAEYCLFIIAMPIFNRINVSHGNVPRLLDDLVQHVRAINKRIESMKERLPEDIALGDQLISYKIFSAVLAYHRQPSKRKLEELKLSKRVDSTTWESLFRACLFGDIETLIAFNMWHSLEGCPVNGIKKVLIDTFETGRIIQDLLKVFRDGRTGGKMKVIRVQTVEIGKKWYSSLDTAVKVASDDTSYCFEVLKDFGTFKVSDLYKGEPDERRYKMHLLIQRKQCGSVKNNVKCDCSTYDCASPSVRCTACEHFHNPVETFEDLNSLPCILILVDKGKMGDTFPESFNCIDLRVRCPDRTKRQRPNSKKDEETQREYFLSTTVQELGRLCRYSTETNLHRLPYALVGKQLMDQLKVQDMKAKLKAQDMKAKLKAQDMKAKYGFNGNATIYGSFLVKGGIDRYIQKGKLGSTNSSQDMVYSIDPARKSYDYKNNKDTSAQNSQIQKQINRILLDAEPQCGKTGTFCHLISRLMRIIYHKDQSAKEDDFDNDCETMSDDEYHDGDYDDDNHDKNKIDFNLSSLKTCPKHVPAFDKARSLPLDLAKVTPASSASGRKAFQRRSKEVMYTAKSLRHECTKCNRWEYASSIYRDLRISGVGKPFKMSVPQQQRYSNLHQVLSSSMASNPAGRQPHKPMGSSVANHLTSWIFMPSQGRVTNGRFNLHHTMCGPKSEHDSTMECKSYIQILVVQEMEFEEYCSAWQTKMAVLGLPATMKNGEGEEMSAAAGGMEYSRMFIQYFAMFLSLSRIFILDDNMSFAEETVSADRQASQCMRENKRVPLYKVLKHMEENFQRDWHTVAASQTGAKPLVLLNIEALQQNCTSKPWQASAEQSTRHNEVCLFKQFQLSTEVPLPIPTLYAWSEETELVSHDGPLVKGEVDLLASWIKTHIPPRVTYKLQETSGYRSLDQLYAELKRIKQGLDVHFVCLNTRASTEKDIKDALRRHLITTEGLAAFPVHVFAIPTEVCFDFSIKTLQDFRDICSEFFRDPYVTVLATDEVDKFQVEIILVMINGGTLVDNDMRPGTVHGRCLSANQGTPPGVADQGNVAAPEDLAEGIPSPKRRRLSLDGVNLNRETRIDQSDIPDDRVDVSYPDQPASPQTTGEAIDDQRASPSLEWLLEDFPEIPGSSRSPKSKTKRLVHNELLTYVYCYVNDCSETAMVDKLLGFYTETDIYDATHCFFENVHVNNTDAMENSKANLIGEVRQVATVLVSTVKFVKNHFPDVLVTFCASDLKRIPPALLDNVNV